MNLSMERETEEYKEVLDVKVLRQAFPLFLDNLPENIRKRLDGPFERFMEWLMAIPRARFIVADNRYLKDGIDFIEGMLRSAGVDIGDHHDLSTVPRKGRLLIACNHPTGVLDMGIVPLIGQVRRDITLVLNPIFTKMTGHDDVHRFSVTVPIFSNPTEKQREAFHNEIEDSLRQEKAVIIFPAAEVAHRWPDRFYEGTPLDTYWKKGVVHYALNTETPILPVTIHTRTRLNQKNSRFFYFIRKFGIAGEVLSQLIIFREVLFQLKEAKRFGRKRYDVTVGEIVPVERIREWLTIMTVSEAAQQMRLMVNSV